MQRGKYKCKQLKAVRKRIADENGIPLEQKECTYDGPCRGTCPHCEAEMKYIEKALTERIRLGRVATVAGKTEAPTQFSPPTAALLPTPFLLPIPPLPMRIRCILR